MRGRFKIVYSKKVGNHAKPGLRGTPPAPLPRAGGARARASTMAAASAMQVDCAGAADAKLEHMINSLALTMSTVLNLRHPELEHGRRPFGIVMHDEIEQAASREQIDELERCMQAMAFTQESYKVANEMRSHCLRESNLVLTRWADKECFNKWWRFTRNRGRTESVLTVGGISKLLFLKLYDMVHDWLLKCDRLMMMAFGDSEGEETEAGSVAFTNTIECLSECIAKRLSLEETRIFDDDEDLSRRVTTKSSEEIASMSLNDETRRNHDILALTAVEALARNGPTSPRGKQVMDDCLDLVCYALNAPPQDMCIYGANAAQANLDLLRRACEYGVDPEVRMKVVKQWWPVHGAYAATAMQQALQTLSLGSKLEGKPLTKVLQTPDDPDCDDECFVLPTTPFVNTARRLKLVRTDHPPPSLGWESRRISRLSTMVAQLLDNGTLERGVVSSRVIAPIATMSTVEAQVTLGMLKIKRTSYTHGTHLIKFCEDIIDNESFLAPGITEAMVCLSHFSMHDITTVMNPLSPSWNSVAPRLTERTLKHLAFKMPEEYIGFAQDAMPIIVRALRNRRDCIGATALQSPSALQQLLTLIPKVRLWNPLLGGLQLDQHDLEHIPDSLSMMLKELSDRKILCQYKRPYLGNQRHSAKKVFVFHTPSLVWVLQGKRLPAVPLKGRREAAQAREAREAAQMDLSG